MCAVRKFSVWAAYYCLLRNVIWGADFEDSAVRLLDIRARRGAQRSDRRAQSRHLRNTRLYRKMFRIGRATKQFPGSSMVEHSAVNRRVASSNLARGAIF